MSLPDAMAPEHHNTLSTDGATWRIPAALKRVALQVNPREKAVMPFGGESVKASGIYRSAHYEHRDHDSEHVLVVGEFFPRCKQCQDVEYVLLKAAPCIEEVLDFNPAKKPQWRSRAN